MNDDYFDPEKMDDIPVVTPGVVVYIQLRDSSYIDSNGNEAFKRSDVIRMRVHTPEGCGQVLTDTVPDGEFPTAPHLYTICTDCIRDWAWDYYISLGDTPAHHGLMV